MHTRHQYRLWLTSATLLSTFAVQETWAFNEALSLEIPATSPGGITSASIALVHPADIESFSLKLSFAGGGILSLPASDWFARGSYFPSTPFGPEPRVELNHSDDSTARTQVYLDGFNPKGTSGNVGRVTLKVATGADPEEDSQIVTLSGEYWSRSEQQVKTLSPVSVELTLMKGDNDGDGKPDNKDPDDDNDGTPDSIDSRPKEAAFRGSETVTANVDQAWKTVTLPSLFANPVVIAGPPSFHDAEGGMARIRNVAEGTFETRFQEWDALDGDHPAETVPYLVLESRLQTMPDGSLWETGTFSLDGTGAWLMRKFNQPFAKPPQLFLTVQSANDGPAVTVRARKVTAKGFDAALFEQESEMAGGHAAETIGYLAIYSPDSSGTVSTGGKLLPYLLQQPLVDERWTPVLSSSLMLQEEKSSDSETAHADEKVSVLALGSQIYAQDNSSLDDDPVSIRCKPPEYKSGLQPDA